VNETGQINCTTPLQGQGVFFSFFKLVLNGPTSSGTVTNTAVVSSPSPDPNPDNNSSTATTIVMPSANLEISKTGPATAQPGGDLTYHFVLSNTGEIAANQVFWDDKLPTGLRFVSIVQDSGPAFTCNPPPGPGGVGTLVCQIPTFPAGTSASFTLVEHLVDTFTSSSIQNFASVFLNTGVGLNRSQTVITAITPGNASNIPAISPLVLLLLAAALAVAGLMMRRLQ
jgi:uncharacterized repeat protein (TIGR01451 family)